ncbi:MAG TPA: choice-of-anchor B family protein, partial [Rhodothermia bacterium]|nr:choice-of-anchor B family protein [Rhodothermia bacterium]
ADVTNKDNPAPLAAATYPNVGYAHQGWLTDDHRYFYQDDEGDELNMDFGGTRTIVWDVSELDDPVLLTEFINQNKASDHNLYVKGDLMYQSNYVSGLRIIDISDRGNPREVGHLDTVPFGDDAPGFAGSWSNYPFFESGSIIVSSIREGLFVVKKSDEVVP